MLWDLDERLGVPEPFGINGLQLSAARVEAPLPLGPAAGGCVVGAAAVLRAGRREIPQAVAAGAAVGAGAAGAGAAASRRGKTEREGFEPSRELAPPTRLAGECLQPLGHLSGRRTRL